MPAPRAAPWDPSVLYSSTVAPLTVAKASANSGLRNMLALPARTRAGAQAHAGHDLQAVP